MGVLTEKVNSVNRIIDASKALAGLFGFPLIKLALDGHILVNSFFDRRNEVTQ
jgi:hypothetical protein